MWNNYTGLIFVISGPSGSGKTTLLEKLLTDRGLRRVLHKSVSFTTRPPRTGERHGRDYFFIPESLFQRKRRAKKLLEWTRYLGYYYATSKEYIEEAARDGRHLALCLDLKGARAIRRLFPHNACLVFVVPPSLALLKKRIENRCRKTGHLEVSKRLRLAEAELKAANQYDYCIVNKDLERAAKELKTIVTEKLLEVKRCKKSR